MSPLQTLTNKTPAYKWNIQKKKIKNKNLDDFRHTWLKWIMYCLEVTSKYSIYKNSLILSLHLSIVPCARISNKLLNTHVVLR